MLAYGLALVLTLASIGLAGFTLNQRRAGERNAVGGVGTAVAPVAIAATPTTTRAAVSTTRPTGTAARPAATRTAPAPAAGASRTRGTAAARSPARPTSAPGPLGSGAGKAVRALGGSIAVTTGSASAPTPTPLGTPATTQGAVSQPPPVPSVPSPTPTPYQPPVANPPVYNPPTPTPVRAAPTPTTRPAPPVYNPPPAPYSPPPAPYSPPPAPYSPPTPTFRPAAPPPATPTPAPTPSPTPVPLPVASLPPPEARSYRYDLSYTLGADLTVARRSDYAYAVTWRAYNAADVAALKDSLGLRGTIEQGADGFRVTDPGTLLVGNGVIRYAAPGITPAPIATATRGIVPTPALTVVTPTASARAMGTATRSPRSTAGTPVTDTGLGDEAALAAAKEWLNRGRTSAGPLLPANADGGRVTRPVAGQTVVTFRPQVPGPLILGDPAIVVTLGPDGVVRELHHHWPAGLAPRITRLRGADAAWADAQAGEGWVEVDWTLPSTTSPDAVFTGAATVTEVTLGWTLAGTENDTVYLVPLHVFSGTVKLDAAPQPVPFRLYVPATGGP